MIREGLFTHSVSRITIMEIFWIFLAFLSGSLPLSVWIGKYFLHKDIRQYGDGNPGATNVWKAGGAFWGCVAILMDGSKGFFPVALANYEYGWQGWPLVAVAVAPVLGHAFSPFLNFQGGKALAATFGVWLGLTLWVGPTVLGLAFAVWLLILKRDAWAVILGSITQFVFFLLIGADWTWLAANVGITAVLLVKHLRSF